MTRADLGSVFRRAHIAGYERLAVVAGGRLARWCRPTHISLVLTGRCDARCVHCDMWKAPDAQIELSTREWNGVLSDIRRWLGPVRLGITGGEIFVRSDALEIIAYGAAIGLFIDVLTSGYGADRASIDTLARSGPGRISVALDAVGNVHSRIRGREGFFEMADCLIRRLAQLRTDEGHAYEMQLRAVVMAHNLDELGHVAQYAADVGASVLYLPITQNYGTPYDAAWYQRNPNWPTDTGAAISALRRLAELKREGAPIANTVAHLETMEAYFRDPAGADRPSGKGQGNHDCRTCASTTNLQINENGDVAPCWRMLPVGNVRQTSVRRIWRDRPAWWRSGCCMDTQSGPGV